MANLQGARFEENPDLYAWFRAREPQAIIGNSIYIYQVPHLFDETGPLNVSLSGVTLADLPETVFEDRFGSNDLRLRWFDARRGLALPNGRMIIAIGEETPPAPALFERFFKEIEPAGRYQIGEGTAFALYDLDSEAFLADYLASNLHSGFILPEAESPERVEGAIAFGDEASLMGYEVVSEIIEPGGELSLMTIWRAEGAAAWPLTIFVHLLDAEGNIVSQYDGLDVPATNWQRGDTIIQIHPIALPAGLPDGPLNLQLGLYRTDTLERLPATTANAPEITVDRVLLDWAVSLSGG